MIYLIRHGLDDENYIGGWSDIDLVDLGKKQVQDTTNYIVENGLVINKIICSDIKRAVSTADIINNKLNCDVFYTFNLRELDKGDFTGVLKKELSSEINKKISNYSINDSYPNGESMLVFYNRIKRYLESLKSLDNVLLVTHRGVINMLYFILNDISLDMNKERFDVEHASLHEMDINKKLIRRIY